MVMERIVGGLADKRRWRAVRRQVKALPAGHRAVAEASERYLIHFGAITNGGVPTGALIPMVEDLADRFTRAAADGAPVRAVVGDDVVAFAEKRLRRCTDVPWADGDPGASVSAIERRFHADVERSIDRERARLRRAVAQADALAGEPGRAVRP